MGWFDDESDDDESENEAPNKQPKTEKSNDTEEDPLDAYMASLSSNIDETNDEKKRLRQNNIERLDYENEDEATSHWKISSSSSDVKTNQDGSKMNQSSFDESSSKLNVTSTANHSSSTAKNAAASLANTFHRAGAKPTSVSSNNPKSKGSNVDNSPNDSDDSDIDLALQKKQSNTIEPLEIVDHSKVKYEPFNRVFYEESQNPSTISPSKWRSEHSISITTETINESTPHPSSLSPILSPFSSSPPLSELLPKPLLNYLKHQNLQKPTLVQAQTFPIVLSGHDTIVTASTGSGKTFAYLIPMIIHCLDQPHIQPNHDGPIGLILVPTRELATQIYSHALKMMKKVGGNVVAVTGGGKGRYELSKELKKGCEIVVSTPGRLIDMLKGRNDKAATNLRRVTMVVLDEADRMLEMGFESQVSSILNNVRPDRHMMMLSATFGRRVEKVAESWLKNPVRIAIGKTGLSSSHVTQHVIGLPSPSSKLIWLVSILPTLIPLGKIIVFVASRIECERVLQSIRQKCSNNHPSIQAESIHGDKHQHDRNSALRQFEKGKIQVLVATDVASRGLDVKNVMTVINYDVAKNLDVHTHRIGRAGRMSASRNSTDNEEEKYQKGIAYSLMTRKDADFANLLMESFAKDGREIENELKELARYSKYFGRSTNAQKKQVHGIGWDRDEFVNQPILGSGTRKQSNSRQNQAVKNDEVSYYGPSSSIGSQDGNDVKNPHRVGKRRRWD